MAETTRRIPTAAETRAERDRRAARAASYASAEGATSPPVIAPAPPDAPVGPPLRLAIMHGGPLGAEPIAVPARPCLHFLVRSPAEWQMVPLAQRRVFGDSRLIGHRFVRYLYSGRTADDDLLYDYVGEVDPASGCVPPRDPRLVLRDALVAAMHAGVVRNARAAFK